MTTLRNKRKLAAVTRETQEENPRNGQSRNTSVPRINEEYITQVSEEIEGRVTKKLSQELNRTESRILGALSKLDEFLLNQQKRTHSGTVPGTFRNTNVENQGTNEDDSQSDPHPEADIFRGQTTQNFGPKDCREVPNRQYSATPILFRTHFNFFKTVVKYFFFEKVCYNSRGNFLNYLGRSQNSYILVQKLFERIIEVSFKQNFWEETTQVRKDSFYMQNFRSEIFLFLLFFCWIFFSRRKYTIQ